MFGLAPETIYTIISVLVIPAVIGFLKKIKLPSKYAPVAAFGVATALVGVGKVIGFDLDVNTLADAIIKGLITAGISVIGYDQVKKLTETK